MVASASIEHLLDLIVCPACRGRLSVEDSMLLCSSCQRRYGLEDGIPVLIVERARPAAR